jgi:hypothetical protein
MSCTTRKSTLSRLAAQAGRSLAGFGAHHKERLDVSAGGVQHLAVALARRRGQRAAPKLLQAGAGRGVVDAGVAGQAVGQDALVAAALAVGVEAHVGQPLAVAGVGGQVLQAGAHQLALFAPRGHRPVDDQRTLGVDQRFSSGLDRLRRHAAERAQFLVAGIGGDLARLAGGVVLEFVAARSSPLSSVTSLPGAYCRNGPL